MIPADWLLAADIHRSDHRLLLADIPYDARPLLRPKVARRYVWRLARLRSEPGTQERFSQALEAGLSPFLAALRDAVADPGSSPPVEAGQVLLADMVMRAAEA